MKKKTQKQMCVLGVCVTFGRGKGHYSLSEDIPKIMDSIRKEAEKADCVQGFNFIHSLHGGCGGGTGTLLLLKIRDNYPDRFEYIYYDMFINIFIYFCGFMRVYVFAWLYMGAYGYIWVCMCVFMCE